jgi:hypothetical protein
MLSFFNSSNSASGRISRRGFLTVGTLGIGGLTLGQLLQLRAQGAVRTRSPKAVIMVYLHGGPSHIDTFDMKPNAPVEFRGEFRPIATKVPGLQICELLPRLATVADQYSVIRNMCFLEYIAGHNPPLVYTGFPTSSENPTHRPTFGSVVSRLRGDAVRDMPPYVAFDGYDTKPGRGTDYLGAAHRPFVPGENMSALAPAKGLTADQMTDRRELLQSFDTLRRDLESAGGHMAAMDASTRGRWT